MALQVTAAPDDPDLLFLPWDVPLAVWPAFIDLGGPLYALTSIGLGGVFMALAINVYHTREGRDGDRAAKQLFGFSILYLFLLFAVLLLEQGLARLAS